VKTIGRCCEASSCCQSAAGPLMMSPLATMTAPTRTVWPMAIIDVHHRRCLNECAECVAGRRCGRSGMESLLDRQGSHRSGLQDVSVCAVRRRVDCEVARLRGARLKAGQALNRLDGDPSHFWMPAANSRNEQLVG
jgi:hypothetical protein